MGIFVRVEMLECEWPEVDFGRGREMGEFMGSAFGKGLEETPDDESEELRERRLERSEGSTVESITSFSNPLESAG